MDPIVSTVPYEAVDHPTIVLPQRERHEDYARHPVPSEILVPERY